MCGGTILLDVHVLGLVLSLATGRVGRTLGDNLGCGLGINSKVPRHLALGTTGHEVERVATLGSALNTTNLDRGNLQSIGRRGLQLKLLEVEGDTRGKRILNAVELNVIERTGQDKRRGSDIGHALHIGERDHNLTGRGADLLALAEAEVDVAQHYLSHGAEAAKECQKGKCRNFLHKRLFF